MQKNKFITILGPTGDLGSQLANYLIKKNMLVQLIVRKGSLGNLKLKIKSYNKAKLLEVDTLLDPILIEEFLDSSKIVFNFAGMVSLSFTKKVFPNVLLINSLFPNILSKINQYINVPIVYASTQRMEVIDQRTDIDLWTQKAINAVDTYLEVYKNKDYLESGSLALIKDFISTNGIPLNINIYELSKAIGEKILQRSKNSIILRVSSCYGPGCSPRRTIGRLIFNRLSGSSIIEKDEVRDYIFAEDLNEIFTKIVFSKLNHSYIYNCCSGLTASKSVIIKEIINDTPDGTGKLTASSVGSSLEAFKPSSEWFNSMLNRDPVSLRSGISKTIRIYKNIYFSKNSMVIHERLSVLYDAMKQKTDEQGLDANEIGKVRDTFFTKSRGEWRANPAFWKPTGLVFGYPFPEPLEDKFITLRTDILAYLGLQPNQYWLPTRNQLHTTVVSYSHYSGTGLDVVALPESEVPTVKSIIADSQPIRITYEGALLTNSGLLLAKGFVDNEDLFLLRDKLLKQIRGIAQQEQSLVHVKLAQILTGDVQYETTEAANRLFSSVDFGTNLFTEIKDPRGKSLSFKNS